MGVYFIDRRAVEENTGARKDMDGQNFSAKLIHETALASLNGEFASVLTTNFLKEIL
jgi:hypothetical protein